MVCALSWLLVGPATAADNNARPGANPLFAPHPAAADFSRPYNTLAPPVMRFRGNVRYKPAKRPGFPAAPLLSGAQQADDELGPMSIFTAEPRDPPRSSGPFRFDRSGGVVVREVPRSYRRMCDSLSGHVWNEPQGKRICFDTRGKPGIAIQIPLN